MSFDIFTDTSANLPTPEVRAAGIGVIPLSYNLDGREHTCLDTETFQSAAYYEAMKQGASITTSQINPQKYAEVMEPSLRAGQDILFVGMSSGISGSFNSAMIARDQLLEDYPDRNILLCDTLGASLGEGLQVLKAVRCREQGMTLEETAAHLLNTRKNMYQLFTVDDLMHLKRGGRLSNAAALLGTLLHIKPLLKGNEEGKIVAFEKIRGRKAVINTLGQRYAKLVKNPEKQIVGISHCGCPEDAQYLANMIQESRPPKEIKIVDHEPVTGSYLGPGAIAIYFEGDDDIRYQ